MAVPWRLQELPVLQARYAAALVEVYDQASVASGQQMRPGHRPQHVFDWPDGLRLIVSRDRVPDGRTGIFLSGSVRPKTPLYQRLRASGHEKAAAMCALIAERWQALADSNRTLDLLGWSPGKGVPHFVLWDSQEAE